MAPAWRSPRSPRCRSWLRRAAATTTTTLKAPPPPARTTATTEGDTATTEGDTATTEGEAATTEGDTATTEGDTATTEGEAEAPTGTPVKIGVIYAETGSHRCARTTSVDDVANAWAEWANTEQGGVNGHPVEIAAVDDTSTGEGAVAAARELVESEGVVGIVIQDSAAEVATVDYLAEQGVPYIGGTANNRPIDGGDTSWPNTHFVTAPSNPGTAAGTLLAASAIGQTAYGATVCAEVPACAEAGQLYEPVVGCGGDRVRRSGDRRRGGSRATRRRASS